MAYTKIANPMTNQSDFYPWAVLITDYLETQGWTLESTEYVSVNSWHRVLSKSGLYLNIHTGMDDYCYFNVGTGWSGSALENPAGAVVIWKVFDMYNAPHPYIHIISSGTTLYILSEPQQGVYNSYWGYAECSRCFGCGFLNKIGVYGSGMFLIGNSGAMFGTRSGLDTNAGNATYVGYHYLQIMLGDVGYIGTPPYMWSRVAVSSGTDWGSWPTTVVSMDKVGSLSAHSMSHLILPIYCYIRDGDAGHPRCIGTFPDILTGPIRGVHRSGDIIDYNGHQYLCWNTQVQNGVSNCYRLDYVHEFYKID